MFIELIDEKKKQVAEFVVRNSNKWVYASPAKIGEQYGIYIHSGNWIGTIGHITEKELILIVDSEWLQVGFNTVCKYINELTGETE